MPKCNQDSLREKKDFLKLPLEERRVRLALAAEILAATHESEFDEIGAGDFVQTDGEESNESTLA